MTINAENKRYFVTISKKDYERLKKIAEKENRSVSKQSLHFIQLGINNYETKE